MQKEQYEKLLAKAFFYLNFRQRTEKEMRTYLSKKAQLIGANENIVQKVITRLYELDYLNDALFVTSYVRSRVQSKPKGEYALKQELRRKGVSEKDIDMYFEEHALDESELAKQALKGKWEGYKRLEFLKRKKRASDFLLRRGFSYESIQSALEWAENTSDTER